MGYLSRWPIFLRNIESHNFLSISICFFCAVEVAYKRVVSNFTLLHKLGFNLIEKKRCLAYQNKYCKNIIKLVKNIIYSRMYSKIPPPLFFENY